MTRKRRSSRITEDNLPDYRGLQKEIDHEAAGTGSYWWKAEPEKLHNAIFAVVDHIDTTQEHKYRALLRAVRMYGNQGISSLAPGLYNQPDPAYTQRLRYNIIELTVDTSTAMISKDRPRVVAMTEGASYRMQRKAKQLSQFWYGLFDQEGVYDQAPAVFRDAALVGAGWMKVAKENGRLRLTRVFMDELLWDDADAVNGNPRALYHRIPIAREKALELWPDHAEMIRKAPRARPPDGGEPGNSVADLIWLVQAWHLPSCDGAKDGWDVLVIETGVLNREQYHHPIFPVVDLPYGAYPPKGWVPTGLALKLLGIQVSINRHLDSVDAFLRLMAVPRIFVDDLSDISVSQINNLIGSIVKYAHGSERPYVDSSSVVSSDLWQQIQWLIQAGFEIAGISRLSATGTKPEGLNSGKALREFTDIESVSFSTIQRAYESFFVRLAKVATRFARDLYASGHNLTAKVPGKKFLQTIKFAEVDLEDDAYAMQVFPTSMLPKTPAARFAQIDEWFQKGWVTKQDAMQLMDMPDLEKASDYYNAQIHDIEEVIDQLLFGKLTGEDRKSLEGLSGDAKADKEAELLLGKYAPDPVENLVLGIEKVRAQYLLARHQEDVPENRRQLLLEWMSLAEDLIKQEQQVNGAAAAMGGMGPPPAAGLAGPPTVGAMPPAPAAMPGM